MNDTNSTTASDFFTAQELLKHGYTFAELMSLAKQGIIRRRRRTNVKGDEIFTFCESDLVAYRNETEGDNGSV